MIVKRTYLFVTGKTVKKYSFSCLKNMVLFILNCRQVNRSFFFQNSTSWVLYNLAGFYWRMKGDLNQATECLRRALHFSPEIYKDVALVSLANILHR